MWLNIFILILELLQFMQACILFFVYVSIYAVILLLIGLCKVLSISIYFCQIRRLFLTHTVLSLYLSYKYMFIIFIYCFQLLGLDGSLVFLVGTHFVPTSVLAQYFTRNAKIYDFGVASTILTPNYAATLSFNTPQNLPVVCWIDQ